MDCRHTSSKDQSRWSPGVNVGKPIELSDMCVLIKHREQWLLWDTGYPDAVADQPVDTPVGHATRAKKLVAQLGELNLKPSDIAFVARAIDKHQCRADTCLACFAHQNNRREKSCSL